MANYYCQVAGLPDVAFDGSKVAFTVERFKEELYPSLSAGDAKCIDLLFLSLDNANILNILKNGEDVKVEQLGCYDKEELVEIISSAKDGDSPKKGVPSYLYRFFDYYFANEGNENIIWNDVLSAYYYDYAISSSNSFASRWFAFNRNVNNILVAFTARKYRMNIADVVIGDDEVANLLRTSAARDFELSGALDYFETVQRLSENGKLQEREHQLDELRWRWLDDNSVFNYFTVERLFVFLQKLIIVERWEALDADKGMERYNKMIAELKSGMDSSSFEV
ncbi:MAG: DUF2764 family protein [Bacteroidaceae bacterium]|nr:DUF2764 family protein [Bacteroidaceae bacterium]